MALKFDDLFPTGGGGKQVLNPTRPGRNSTGGPLFRPSTPPSTGRDSSTSWSNNSSGGFSGGGSANQAARDQSEKENKATQEIIDALRKSISGYASGRDVQLKNAATALEAMLAGIESSYGNLITDYEETRDLNNQDEAGKSAANVQNRARERMSLLQQAASQGAGETDQLRAQLQAFQNFDANQAEVTRAHSDTERSINSQIAGANSQAEASRRSAWQQNQEHVADAWNSYWKNYTDAWTNIQRTANQNSNIDSDFSVAFNPNFGGKNPVDEASRYAGKTYQQQNKDEEWYKNFMGRVEGRDTATTATNRAAAVSINAPRAAEGATLRREW